MRVLLLLCCSLMLSSAAQAQSGCPACNMLFQQGAGQCQYYRNNYQMYQYCMATVQQNVGRCMQACAGGGGYGGGGYGGGGYGYPGQNVPLCQQYPNNPACR